MPLNKGLQVAGIAKQTAKGSIAANPTFAHGVGGGVVGGIEITQERSPLTSASRATPYLERNESAGGGGSYPFRAHPKSIGLYLFAALGAKGVTGAGPYVHTITDSTSLPYLTLFGKYGGSIIHAIQDCRVDELSFTWDEAGTVVVDVSIMGTTPNFSATFTPGTDDTNQPYFQAAGGTYKLDITSGTPVTARVKGGKITIKNSVEPVRLSASIIPNEQYEGNVEIDWELTVVTDTDLAEWRKIVTGSGSGATISQVPVTGSAEVTFVNGTDSLKFESLRVGFNTTFPEADPAGGAAELVLAGMAVQPLAGGAALTAVLTNGQATY